MSSLRTRAIAGGLLWTMLSVVAGGIAVLSVFDSIADSRFNDSLLERHIQVAVALANSDGSQEGMERLLIDPAYERPYSGRYWQIRGPAGETLGSRSMFDFSFKLPEAGPVEQDLWVGPGPEGRVRGVLQSVELDDGQTWVVATAEDVRRLEAERDRVFSYVVTAFAFFCLSGVLGAVLLTTSIIRPLAKLRQDVAHRWDGGTALEPADYPTEVAPLVSDINTLLARNRDVIEQARRQAGDLAHALKTPTAVLRNELDALIADDKSVARASEALDRIDQQIKRSLARMRAAYSHSVLPLKANAGHSGERLIRMFRALGGPSAPDLSLEAEPGTIVAMDAQDFEELLGNLIENALKWARHTVLIRAERHENRTIVTIEDDGPGIPSILQARALEPGGRLDTAVPGTGLGLAIAQDLAQAYGGMLSLGKSVQLGGLAVTVSLPRAGLED